MLLLIELPQTKLGLNVSEVRVIGQLGNVCRIGGVRGIPVIHKAAGKYRKFTYTCRACYLEEAIYRKWK